jgi:hypothetical protein
MAMHNIQRKIKREGVGHVNMSSYTAPGLGFRQIRGITVYM